MYIKFQEKIAIAVVAVILAVSWSVVLNRYYPAPLQASDNNIRGSLLSAKNWQIFHVSKEKHLPEALPAINNAGKVVTVLMYHHIGDLPAHADYLRYGLTVSTKDFSAQVDYLKNSGYQTITAEELSLAWENKFKLPERPLIFSFDDGYEDVFSVAEPILEKNNFIGTFAIITGFVGTPGYAGWPVINAARSKNMEIVSHSFAHIDFTNPLYSTAYKENQIKQSVADLKAQGIATHIFIYPYGHYDADTEQLLEKNGFTMAFTTRAGMIQVPKVNPLELPRVRVAGGESMDLFARSLR